jgi:hypothetical protein
MPIGRFSPFAFGLNDNEDDGNAKLSHDRYEVFVDGEFVGYKPLLVQNDHISDIDDFLQQEGATEFSSELNGDHYNINTKGTEQSQKIKDSLKIHLSIR